MKTVATLVLALALLPSALAAPVVTSAAWGTAAAPIEAAPGDTARLLTVTVQNTDDQIYASARAQLFAADGISPAPGGDKAALAGVFAPGGLWTMTFLVNVADDADATARLPLKLTMQYADSLATLSRSLEVPVELSGRPALALAATQDALPSWSRVDLPIEVRNEGSGPAGGLVLRATPATGSALATGDDGVRAVGGLAANASRTVDISVVTGAPGAAALSVALTYTNAAGAPVTETRTLALRIVDEAPTALRARLAGSALEPGAPGTATFRIENAGEDGAHDVSVRLALPATASVLDGSDEQFLGDIKAGAARDATFLVRPASAARDLLDVALTLTWKDDDGVVHTVARKDALPLAQASSGALRIGLASPTIAAGAEGALAFDVANEGSAALRDVRVSFALPTGAVTAFTPVNATDSQTLGDLAAGATTRATLQLLTSQSAKDIYPFAATASWVGEDGIVRTETFRFGVLVRGTVQLVVTDGAAIFEDGVATLSGTLTNLGNVKAHNAYLRVVGSAAFDETESQFLGDLDPNSALPFSIDADARGSPTSAPLQLTWNDEYGQIHEARFDTPVRQVESASADDDEEKPGEARSPWPTVAMVLGALAVVAYAVRRKLR